MKFLERKIYSVIYRTYEYLEQTGRTNSFGQFPYLKALTDRLGETETENLENAGIQLERYRNVLVLMEDGKEGDYVLQTALDLSLAAMFVPEFGAYLNYYTGKKVTLQLAYEIEGIPFPDYEDVRNKAGRLQRVFVTVLDRDCINYTEINTDYWLFAYLMGSFEIDPILLTKAKWFLEESMLHELYIRQELVRDGVEYITSGGKLLQISGKGGRRFLVKHIARNLKKDVLMVDAEKLPSIRAEEFSVFGMQLVREVFFRNGAVCFYHLTQETEINLEMTVEIFLEAYVYPFIKKEIPVFLCTDQETHFEPEGGLSIQNLELSPASRSERELVWKGFAEQYKVSFDSVKLSVFYKLSASEIAAAAAMWVSRRACGEEGRDLSRICYQIVCNGLTDRMGSVIYSNVSMEDLKVSDEIREMIGQICTGVTESYRIFETWNLKKHYSYGKAVTVLLTGPPGTGKTMTAHVIAKELGIPLYQVNLSSILDKYIGETEKHLEQAFDFAEKTNMVLFFDEADSLFGKRGEVSDVKDKYANMEVSYILQRIEQFDGIAVLATNFLNNIDKAFLRRMKYVIKYTPPNEMLRYRIWESCLPNELPCEELDLSYLAKQFDFTGGIIKNVILNACNIAVYKGQKLNMEHMLGAIRNEYGKMDRMVSARECGEYGYLIEDTSNEK